MSFFLPSPARVRAVLSWETLMLRVADHLDVVQRHDSDARPDSSAVEDLEHIVRRRVL